MEENVLTQDNYIDEAAARREREQFVKMTQTPIPKLIISLGIPTTLNMMITSLYNLADTYFVSGLGQEATGAVNVVLSLMSIIQAIGFTFGMGSGSIVSKLLGKRRQKEADVVSSTAFFTAGAVGLFICIFGLLFLDPLLWLLGATEEVGVAVTTLEYSRQYTFYILLAAPISCMTFVLNNLLRSQGKALLSMVGLVTGAVLNIILDPIFIYTFGMGMRGAAIATAFSQVVGFGLSLFMFLSGKTITRLRFSDISKQWSIHWEIIATGFPSFCRQILASLCTVLLNWSVKPYDGALAALGVVQKVFMMAFSISLGIGQGYQPVLGYNYSAKFYKRVRAAYKFTVAFSVSLMVVFAIVSAIFAEAIMQAFLESPNAVQIGALSLRLQCICMPLLPINFMISVTSQTVGNKAIAAILSVSRQGLFYIPAVIILPAAFGLFGVQSCQAISDFCAFLFAIPFTLHFFKTVKELEKVQEQEQVCDET